MRELAVMQLQSLLFGKLLRSGYTHYGQGHWNVITLVRRLSEKTGLPSGIAPRIGGVIVDGLQCSESTTFLAASDNLQICQHYREGYLRRNVFDRERGKA
jgi:hypothetical protein